MILILFGIIIFIVIWAVKGNLQEEEPEYGQDFTEFQAEGNISGFELVGSRDDLIVSVEGKSEEVLELVMLNQETESEDEIYVILVFLDWKQIPIDGEHMKYYVTVPAITFISIPIALPDVEEAKVFQINLEYINGIYQK